MARYSKSKIGRYKNKKNSVYKKDILSYRTTYYGKIPTRYTDIQIITQDGDRLDNLSMTFYKNPWSTIYSTNNFSMF